MKLLFLLLLCLISPTITAKITVENINYTKAWHDFSLNAEEYRPKQQFPYQQCFKKSAQKYNLPISLLIAMARGESDFNSNAHSSANAYGVMQIVWPTTAKELGIDTLKKLKDPCTNIDAGAHYIKKQIKRFNGNIHLALAAYNYGPQRIADNRFKIPKGANWYSGYIYQHLQYVIGNNKQTGQFSPPKNYSDEDKLFITSFKHLWRASAFISAIKKRTHKIRLDTFNYSTDRYHVVLLYGSKKELVQSKKNLKTAGFNI